MEGFGARKDLELRDMRCGRYWGRDAEGMSATSSEIHVWVDQPDTRKKDIGEL